MKPRSFRKIRQFLRPRWKSKSKREGTLTILSVFLFMIFSTLGLGMLYLTQVYLKSSAYRKNTLLLEFASENGVKQGFDQLHELLSLATSPVLLSETETLRLLNDSRAGGNDAVQRVLGCSLPLDAGEDWERLAWESHADFQFVSLFEDRKYFHVEYKGKISAAGKLQGFKREKISALESKLEILAGHIPLAAIPFLLDKAMTSEQRKNFLEENDINMIPSELIDLSAPAAFSDGELLPQQALEQLAEALNIEIFHPQDLTAPKLRLALGLEVNNEPVPKGVYLIQGDIGLGGVFVQGDLDEMILAIQDNYQLISFRQGLDLWVLRFSPDEGKTIFAGPDGVRSFDLVPLGIIIVNGKIHSLGGGYEEADGQILMADTEEMPSVIRGLNLTIISSDEITLSSHLIYQGVTWKEGVPYVRDSDSQLVIHAAGQDFLSGEEKAGQIIIGDAAPEELKIQASLTASGMGIAVHGEDKKVQVFGGLQTSDLVLNGNEVNIKFDDRFFRKTGEYFQNVPVTEVPVLYISWFRVTGWKENV